MGFIVATMAWTLGDYANLYCFTMFTDRPWNGVHCGLHSRDYANCVLFYRQVLGWGSLWPPWHGLWGTMLTDVLFYRQVLGWGSLSPPWHRLLTVSCFTMFTDRSWDGVHCGHHGMDSGGLC